MSDINIEVVHVGWVAPTGERNFSADLTAIRANRFEDCLPVRTGASRFRNVNMHGQIATTKSPRPLFVESRLEGRAVLAAERDLDVEAVSTQSMLVEYLLDGEPRHLVYDLFLRHRRGDGLIQEVKPARPRLAATVERRLEVGRRVAHLLGFGWEMWTDPPPVEARNVAWLAGFRRPQFAQGDIIETVLDVVGRGPASFGDLQQVGPSERVRPVLFHLMWHHLLNVDMTVPLNTSTIVSLGPMAEAGEWAA